MKPFNNLSFPVRASAAVAAALMGLNTPAFAAEEQQIKIAHNMPEQHATGTFFTKFAEEVDARTANTSVHLVPQVFADGQLYNDTQLPDAISNGAVNVGQINLGFMAGPDAEALRIWAMPFLYGTWEAEWAAEDSQAFQTVFSTQLAKYDQELLGWTAYGTVEIYSNKPVKTPADLQGMRIRAFGLDSAEFLRDVGAAPVTMSSQEVYQAMQRGTIDGFATGPSSVLSRKLYEVSNYGTDVALTRLPFIVSANKAWFDELPDDTKVAVREAAAIAQKASREQGRAQAAEEVEKLRQVGVEIHEADQEELKQWSDAAKTRQEAYIKAAGTQGAEIIKAVEAANKQFPTQ